MKIVIVDFGAPGVKKIVKFLRSQNIKTSIYNPCDKEKIPSCDGVILSGGPDSVCDSNHLRLNEKNNILKESRVPILGICYGAQLICKHNGGRLKRCNLRECFENIIVDRRYGLYKGLEDSAINVKFRHSDYILELPSNFTVTSSDRRGDGGMIFSFQDSKKNIYAVQYHPEIEDEEDHKYDGEHVLNNFLSICRSKLK
jgi:GMP synthase (glutamine-hydrolysing)